MKKKVKLEPTIWLPLFTAAAVLFLFLWGVVFIFSQQEEALQDASYAEKRWFSLKVDPSVPVDPENPGSAKNVVENPSYAMVGPVYSADGIELFSPARDSACPAWYSLIGFPGMGERYLTCTYEPLFLPNSISLFTGTRGSHPESLSLTLTIPDSIQETMYQAMTQAGVQGNCFAFDTATGETLAMVSTTAEAGLNANLYSGSPGSTFKPVTILLAARQGIDLSSRQHTCTGSYTLQADGTCINCTGVHGSLDAVHALANSCNCWFAALCEKLDPVQTCKDLLEMGFTVSDGEQDTLGRSLSTYQTQNGGDPMDFLPRSASRVVLHGTWDFESVFNLIGQTSVQVNPIHMSYVLSCIAAGENEALFPHLKLTPFSGPKEVLFPDTPDEDALAFTSQLWKQAFAAGYGQEYGRLDLAKTGTTQVVNGGFTDTQKRLTGMIGTTFFYIAVDNHQTSSGTLGVLPLDLANTLAGALGNDLQE